MRRGRPPFADDPAARRRSSEFFGEMPAPRASTNAASRLASVLGGRARSRDPSPSARRVPTHAVAFGTTVRSPRVSPHVTPRATPQSSPVKAGAAWNASDRYLARVRERERDVRREREGDGDVSDENRSDLFELSDDSIDERVSAVFPSHAQDSKRGSRHARSPSRSRSPGPRSSLDNQDKSPGRVDRRARSESRESRGASPSPSTAPSPRSARRRVAFVAEKRNPETLEATSAPPEPRGATSVPKPVEATHRNEPNPIESLRKRLPKKPELARKKISVSPAASSDRAFVVDAFVRDGDGANSSDGSGVDAAELATPSPEPTRIASRVFEERHDAADAADAKKDVGSLATERAPPESPTLTPSTRLVDSIAARGSGDLLDSVTPAAEEFEATALERGGSGSGSVSFEFAGDAFADDAETSARTLSGVTKYAHTRSHRSPLGSPVRAAHFSPRSSPKTSSPSRRAEAAKTAWVPPGVAPPRAAGEDASPRAANLFASEMFASPLADGHAFSPFSGASEASALSASGSAAKAAAAAARRRFAFAAAVMGDAARFERGSFSAEDREKRARCIGGASSSLKSPGANLSGDALNGEKPRSPNTTASNSLVAELLDVARALGEETHARAAEEAARKLAVASARAEARVAALSEANRLKLAKRESAHRLRAACRALRHRLRQWRSHASTTRLVRAAGRKWRAAARRKAETDAFHERRAAAFFAEARLASGLKALRAWRCRTAERRGMATLALLAVTGALMKRTQSAFDAWRREASVAAREKIVGTLNSKKAERFAKKALRRRLAKTFVVWADSSFEARHVRETVELKVERTRVLTLGRCVHAWYGVAQRKSNETLAALREVVAEARLRSALRAMADRNRERARIRTWYLTVRGKHLRALGHWAFGVTRRALTSWRALAVAGRRTRARRRTFAALKKVVAAQTAEDAFFAFGRSSTSDGFLAAANSAFDVSDFPTPSPLRGVFGDESSSGDSGEDLAKEKEKRVPGGTSGDEFRKFQKRASVASSKDENASSFARSLRALKTSRRGKEPSCLSRGGSSSRMREPLRPVGSSRLAADAALLARATARLETYAAAPTTPRRVAMKVGAVSAHASTRKKSARRFSASASALDGTATERLSPVSFGGYVSPAAARARLWEAPELSESLRELAPTVWRAAFEEGGEKANNNDARVEDERAAEGEAPGAAERLLELARRGKRRVAWRA